MNAKLKRFFWNTVIIICCFMALMVFAGDKMLKLAGLEYGVEAIEYSKQLVTMDGVALNTLLKAGEKPRPTILLLYASWCPYCKQQFQILKALQMRYPPEMLQIAYISVENSPYALSDFLMKTYPDKPFTQYYVTNEARESFLTALHEHGASFNGGVPYLIFFDRNGRKAQEIQGMAQISQILEIVKPLVE